MQIDASNNVIVEDIRQSFNYIKAQDLFRKKDSSDFAAYVSCAPYKSSKTCLRNLFGDSQVNDSLLKICRFHGHAARLSWNTVQTFDKLLCLAPKELRRVLGRLAEFWEAVASLADSKDSRTHIYEDYKSINDVSGLWPLFCGAHRAKLKKPIFPGISSQWRNKILKLIETSEFRVPTMGLVVSEANFFLEITKQVKHLLRANGNGYRLQCSEITDDTIVLEEQTYLRFFLVAAQHVNVGGRFRTASEDYDIKKQTTECRHVNCSPNFWKGVTPTEVFTEIMFGTVQPHYVKGNPSVCLIVKDFLESFFGTSMLQNLSQKMTQGQIDMFPELMQAFSLTKKVDKMTQCPSDWDRKSNESEDCQILLEPEPLRQDVRLKPEIVKAQGYISEAGEVYSPVEFDQANSFAHKSSLLGWHDVEDYLLSLPNVVHHAEEYHREPVTGETQASSYSSEERVEYPSKKLVESYGPFSLLNSNESVPIVKASSSDDPITQSGSMSDLGSWDAQTLVYTEDEQPIVARTELVGQELKISAPTSLSDLYKMLDVKEVHMNGKRVLMSVPNKP